jgi:anti-anti-sigma factor
VIFFGDTQGNFGESLLTLGLETSIICNLEPVIMTTREFVQLSTIGSVNVIELWLPEELDSEEFDRLNESLQRATAGKRNGKWVLDLSAVDYMGSSVLGMMINIRQHIKSGGGKLALSGLTPRMAQIFRTCCLEKLFEIYRTRDEAAKNLK